jgi:HK97 family phage major capsid protein
MGDILSKGALFPPQLTNELISLVKGSSSLAKLSGATPIPFNGTSLFTFALDNEVDLVAENGAKSNGGATIGTITMQPVKVEYGLRVSDEFMYASDEIQLQYLSAFADGFSKKVARGLDIMAFHGVNPRTKVSASALTNKNFDDLVTQTVTFDSLAPNDNVEAAIALVQGNEYDVSGMAMAPAFKSALAGLKRGSTSYEALFPELGWGAAPGTINGLPVDSNSTVSFNSGSDRAIVGDFQNYFRWGIAKQIPIKVIEYGNPDNDATLGDLQGHNQVYIRGEAYIGWAILLPEAFSRIVANASG